MTAQTAPLVATPVAAAQPTAAGERIQALDVIRGFALFGVLLMNLYGHPEFALPEAVVAALPTARIDAPLGFLFDWLVDGKAQALFSMLFGFGFALFLERAEARGASGTRLYLRRLLVLAVIGFLHAALIWYGDILHAYALTGFCLILVRRWPPRALLVGGLLLSLFATFPILILWAVQAADGSTPPVLAAFEAGLARRYPVFLDNDPVAYVRELIRGMGPEWMGGPFAWSYFATVLGRFLIGYWIFRTGWLSRPGAITGRLATALLAIGLTTALADAALKSWGPEWGLAGDLVEELLHRAGQLTLALGYGAVLFLLVRRPGGWSASASLAAVGRMALTNYLMQSLVYLFVFYGFGLGLLRYGGALVCLLVAVPAFAAQIVFSRWWLARFRFGPAEWLWRSATYGRWQPMR
jgi:uncharacterized protein